ncbi:MAG: DegV family protein [Butyrivibrio sp.]|nr:DegV family protein [Butyrivibrio sp.]
MSFKIVYDSCCDLPEEYYSDPRFQSVPLSLEVGDYHIMDDETFDQAQFLKHVAESEECPKSACPSPDSYMQAFKTDADHVYCITLSSKLSGSYNSALIGKDLYEEEFGQKDIFIVDSLSASCGLGLIALKIMEYEEQGLSFEEIVEKISAFRDDMTTFFVLDNLETLRKNGRLSGMKALVAATLSIKPVCEGVEGNIVQRGQGVGIRKALVKMVDLIEKESHDTEDRILAVSHCNNFERAMLVRDMILARKNFKDSIVVDTRGVSSMYANDGGIVVTY